VIELKLIAGKTTGARSWRLQKRSLMALEKWLNRSDKVYRLERIELTGFGN
jgi:hypothetical protein